MAVGWVPAAGPSVALEVFHWGNNTASNSLLHKDFPTFKMVSWISLVVPWLRVCLLMKGTQVLTPRQGRHHMLQSSGTHAPHLLKPARPRPELCSRRSRCNGERGSEQPGEACTATKTPRGRGSPSRVSKKRRFPQEGGWTHTHTQTHAYRYTYLSVQFSPAQSLSRVRLFATP